MTGYKPDDLLDSPRVSLFAADLWDAWGCLSGSRQWTMGGPAPIAVSEILAYAVYQGIDDPDGRDRLLKVISELDGVYLEEARKKSEG